MTVDLTKPRNDIREFINQRILHHSDSANQYSENIKMIMLKINQRKQESGLNSIPDTTLLNWIKQEITSNPRLLLKGFELNTLSQMYADAVQGYGILQSLVEDDRYSDIVVIKYDTILAKGRNGWELQNIAFGSPKESDEFIQAVFNKQQSMLNIKYPFNNCIDPKYRLRINGSIGDINPQGSFMVLRKQNHYQLTDEQIIEGKTANEEMLALITVYLWMELSFFVFGEQNTGKTTFLANCLDKIPEHVRLTTLEDTPEFALNRKNWHSHVTRPHVGEGYDPVTLEDLIFNFYRESGQWICVGEVRGKEAFYLLHASSGGNPACMSVHAPSQALSFKRLLFLSLVESGMREDTLEGYFKTYFKMMIGMVSEDGLKRVDTISIENDERTGYVDVWKRIPGGEWEGKTLPNWFINKAKESNLPRELLKKARVI